MEVSATLLIRIATFLLVVAVVHNVTSGIRRNLTLLGLSMALACGATTVALLVAAVPFEANVLLFGVGTAAGLSWTGATGQRGASSLAWIATAVAVAVAASAILAFVSLHYRWWVPPGLMVTSLAAALTLHVVRLLRGYLPGAPAVTLPVACPACGLSGKVTARLAGQAIACPRCKMSVPVRPVASIRAAVAVQGSTLPRAVRVAADHAPPVMGKPRQAAPRPPEASAPKPSSPPPRRR